MSRTDGRGTPARASRPGRRPASGGRGFKKHQIISEDDFSGQGLRSEPDKTGTAQDEIISEDENAPSTQQHLAFVAEFSCDLPRLPDLKRVEARLLESTPKAAEVYIDQQIKPSIASMVGVGHEALYLAIQFVAQLYALIQEAPGPRAEYLYIALGVKVKAAKPIHALINNLFGLPDASLHGEDVRKAASNRHAKYAKAIEGAFIRQIPPSELAAELQRDGGLYRLAEVARENSRHGHSASTNDAGSSLTVQIERDDPDSGEDDSWDASHADEVGPSHRKVPAASRNTVDVGLVGVKLAASQSNADNLSSGDGIALCLVDRDEEVPELFAGVPVPERLRHDREEALAWVRAAIKSAVEADREDETEADEEADDDR